jgi:hypothetical protein
MASDISLAVGDGARRMTYAELADVRGISAASAERLVRRRRWSRQAGNDGVVRVLVPLTEAQGRRKSAPARVRISEPDNRADVRMSPLISAPDIPPDVRTLESALETLREQLAKANQWAEVEHARADRGEQRVVDKDIVIDHLRGRLDQLMALLADRRPWWRRWFR